MTSVRSIDPTDYRLIGSGATSLFAYVLAAILVAALVWAGGLWNLLANTRILSLLTRSGVIAFTDADQGFYRGVPDAHHYVASQDPLEWLLLVLTIGLFLAAYGLRALRGESVARFVGIALLRRTVSRAFMRGQAAGTFVPYGAERAATARALLDHGATEGLASQVLAVTRFLQVLELGVFTLIGLVTISWSTALGQLVLPAVMFGLAFFLVRPALDDGDGAGMRPFAGFRHAAAALSHEPTVLARLGALSMASFAFEAIAVYALSQVFSSTHVLLNVDFPMIMMALVGARVASLAEITPGALGQAEWGMASALYIGGVGIPEAVTMAVLYAMVRYALAAVMVLVLRLLRPGSSIPELLAKVEPDGDH